PGEARSRGGGRPADGGLRPLLAGDRPPRHREPRRPRRGVAAAPRRTTAAGAAVTAVGTRPRLWHEARHRPRSPATLRSPAGDSDLTVFVRRRTALALLTSNCRILTLDIAAPLSRINATRSPTIRFPPPTPALRPENAAAPRFRRFSGLFRRPTGRRGPSLW